MLNALFTRNRAVFYEELIFSTFITPIMYRFIFTVPSYERTPGDNEKNSTSRSSRNTGRVK